MPTVVPINKRDPGVGTLVFEPKALRTGAIFTDRDVAFRKGLGSWGSE